MPVENQEFLKVRNQRAQKAETHNQLPLPLKMNICSFKETERHLRIHLIVSRGTSGRIQVFLIIGRIHIRYEKSLC